MLRDQLLRCQEYERKGGTALGPIVSLSSAIQDEKIERKTAELVMHAQQETLSRFNSNIRSNFLLSIVRRYGYKKNCCPFSVEQREELILKTAQSKQTLLQALKNQVEESVLFKEKEKELEMLADRLLLEKVNREQEMQEQGTDER